MKSVDRFWGFFTFAALAVAIASLVPWIHTRVTFPDEPLDVSIIYRDKSGDIQYFPLISQLSRGTVTDFTVKETSGSTLRSFSSVSLLPYAISFATFGKYGFPIADAIISVGYFALLVLLIRTIGASLIISTIVALVLALQIPFSLAAHINFGPIDGQLPLITQLWGMRIPRPFVTELLLLLVLVSAMRLLASGTPGRPIRWLALAGSFGLLVQADLYSAMMVAFSSPLLVICVARRQGVWPTIRVCLLAGLLLSIVVAPFVLQRLLEHPDIPVRWGVYKVGRLSGFNGSMRRDFYQPAFAMTVVWFVAYQMRRQPSLGAIAEKYEPVRRLWGYCIALLFAAAAYKPLSFLILGQTIQPYHFEDRSQRVCSYIVIGFTVVWMDGLLHRLLAHGNFVLWHKSHIRKCVYASACLLFLGLLGYKGGVLRSNDEFRSHLRHERYVHTSDTHASYRENFTEIAAFLDNTVPQDSVIASFDHQLFSWWLTFHNGHWFLAEPFVSSAPDGELELRLALLCKLLGMSTEDYIEFIQNDYINIFWLGLAKYQASSVHCFSPINDYTENQRLAIHQSDSAWQLIIPQSELRRLTKQFEAVEFRELEKRALDVIILSKSGPESALSPPEQQWEVTFENDAFRVYTLAK